MTCWFLCDYVLDIEDVSDGVYYLHTKVVTSETTKYLVSDDTYTINNPSMEISISVELETVYETFGESYHVEIDVPHQNVGTINTLYWQVSETTEYDTSNWVEADTCWLLCDFVIDIENVPNGDYYLHTKVVTSEVTEYFISTGTYSIEMPEVLNVTLTPNSGQLGAASYHIDALITYANVGTIEVLYWQTSNSSEYDTNNWVEADSSGDSSEYEFDVIDLPTGGYYIHTKVVTSEKTEYFVSEHMYYIDGPDLVYALILNVANYLMDSGFGDLLRNENYYLCNLEYSEIIVENLLEIYSGLVMIREIDVDTIPEEFLELHTKLLEALDLIEDGIDIYQLGYYYCDSVYYDDAHALWEEAILYIEENVDLGEYDLWWIPIYQVTKMMD